MLEQLNRSFEGVNHNMHELTIYNFMSDKLNLYSDIIKIYALRQHAQKTNIKVNVVEMNETKGASF